MNAEHARFRLPKITKLDNARVTIIIALHSHSFMSLCDSNDEFKNVLNKVRGSKHKLKLHEDASNSHKLSYFYE